MVGHPLVTAQRERQANLSSIQRLYRIPVSKHTHTRPILLQKADTEKPKCQRFACAKQQRERKLTSQTVLSHHPYLRKSSISSQIFYFP